MSGLLVKSTVVMRENLERMSRDNLRMPVMLGGAALTRNYVETDCAAAYASGQVAYARDAFDGLSLMDKVVNGNFAAYVGTQQEKRKAMPATGGKRVLGQATRADQRPVNIEETRLRRSEEPTSEHTSATQSLISN